MDPAFSPFHWLVVLFIVGLGFPIYRILRRIGFNGLWCLLCFVPLGNFIGLWVLAFKRWPIDPPTTVQKEKRIENLQQELADLQKQ